MGKNDMKPSRLLKKKRRRRGLFIVEVIVLLVLIGALAVYAKLNGALDRISDGELDMEKVGVNEGIDTKALHGFTTIALVGLDTRPNDPSSPNNSDTMIIANIDNDTKKVKLVSVYRDTYLNVGDNHYSKANNPYAVGGPEKFLTMLNKNLDLNIKDYVTVNFQSMVEAIDILGGLEITLEHDEIVFMNDYCKETSEVTGKSYDPIEPADGTYHLNGVQAVSYARIRYTAGNDFKRTARQRLLIYKMVEKAKQADLGKLNKILETVFQPDMVVSSLSKAQILKMGMDMLSYDIEDQAGFPFYYLFGERMKEAIGQDSVLPVTLEANVKRLHEFLYPDEAYMPSATVQEYSNFMIEKSGYGEESIPQETDDGTLPADLFP